jgi:hypothetical protein
MVVLSVYQRTIHIYLFVCMMNTRKCLRPTRSMSLILLYGILLKDKVYVRVNVCACVGRIHLHILNLCSSALKH